MYLTSYHNFEVENFSNFNTKKTIRYWTTDRNDAKNSFYNWKVLM